MNKKKSDVDSLFEESRALLEMYRAIYGDAWLEDESGGKADETVSESPAVDAVEPEPAETGTEDEMTTLDSLRDTVSVCMKCAALCRARNNTVFGEGNPDADVMFIGEAPGADEDRTGRPFVGRAGQLLTKILAAIDFPREEVFIANILKCRPPNNRNPMADEVANCEPYLLEQIELIRPKIICALGRVAANTLLKNTLSLRDLRASTQTYHGVPLIVTYHPAALLRNPHWKKATWEDVQKLRKMYDELKGKG